MILMLRNKLHLHVNYIQITISVGARASFGTETHNVCSAAIDQDPRNFYFLFESNFIITRR